jgi:hypothetical protein
MTFDIPQLIEWNNYYPCPEKKVRLGVRLFNPRLFIENKAALSHDFFYFSDEFSIIFHPLTEDDSTEIYMLVEGPHENPLGERVPILSTWSHLKVSRSDVAKSGIQHNFVFYDNRWWEAKFEYDYVCEASIDINAHTNFYWCQCNPYSYRHQLYPNDLVINGHIYYGLRYKEYTIYKDTKQTDFYKLYKECYPNDLGVLADWLEERGDEFCNYLRTILSPKGPPHPRLLPEVCHISENLEFVENDRAAKLRLLALGITR